MVKGGVAPAILTSRGKSWLVETAPAVGVVTIGEFPEFSRIFNVPWTVGAEFAWNASKRVQFFLEYAFTQATGKNASFSASVGVVPVVTAFTSKFSDYRTHAGYLGARYYFEPLCCFSCCGPIAPYVGFKAGFAWQQHISRSLTIGTFEALASAPYFINQTAISGGLQIGLEWWFCKCWSLLLQGEFVGTQGPRPKTNVVLDNSAAPPAGTGFSNLIPGHFGWVCTFPVTLGLRWTF